MKQGLPAAYDLSGVDVGVAEEGQGDSCSALRGRGAGSLALLRGSRNTERIAQKLILVMQEIAGLEQQLGMKSSRNFFFMLLSIIYFLTDVT